MSKVILAVMVVVMVAVPILALHQSAQAAYGCPVGQGSRHRRARSCLYPGERYQDEVPRGASMGPD